MPEHVEYQLQGSRFEADPADASDVPFEVCDPVRAFPIGPGKRHYSGLLFMDSAGCHIAFESLAERSFLVELDRTPGVVAVASQPMWVHWVRGDRPPHAPDYARTGAGTLSMLSPDKTSMGVREQFDRTALLCREVGWRYVVFAEDARVRESNLNFLMRYREPTWASNDARQRLCSRKSSVVETRRAIPRSFDYRLRGALLPKPRRSRSRRAKC